MSDGRAGRRKLREGADDWSPTELEALGRLMVSYPDPVNFDRLFHLTNGSWGTPTASANVVSDVRSRLGWAAVETVKGSGYRLGSKFTGEGE